MVKQANQYALSLALLFVAAACGSEDPETSRAKVGAAGLESQYSVSLGLEDGSSELALVSQAFSGYVLSLAGGDACWGPQAKVYDSASATELVVRKDATGCGVNILKLRFKEGTAEVLAVSTEAAGLEANAGKKGSFLVGTQRAFEVKVTAGLVTTTNSVVLLVGRELKVDTAARHVIQSCKTPWGAEIEDGASVVGFATATVPYGSNCSSKTLVCSDGTLSNPEFKFQACAEPTLQTLTLSSDKNEVLVGASGQLTLKAKFSDGSFVTVVPESFTTQPATLVQITAAGVWKGLGDGAFSVTAKFGGSVSNALSLFVYKLVNEAVTVKANTAVSKMGFTAHWSGGVGIDDDATTANMVCVKMGYLSGTIVNTDNYVAPYNETLWFWNGSAFTFKESRGNDRDHIENLNCIRQCKVSGTSKVCTPN